MGGPIVSEVRVRPPSQRHTVVCVDDEPIILSALSRALEDEPYEVVTTDDPGEVLRLIGDRDISLIIADQRMPRMTGVELLETVRRRSPATGCVILTGYSLIEPITAALRGGRIQQVVRKPWDDGALKDLVRDCIQDHEAQVAAGEDRLPRADTLAGLSAAMEDVRRMIRALGAADSTVLITGETGTGKELVARAIHGAGPRSGRPFVAIDCGALSETLLASELFGHARGAFTGADHSKRGLLETAAEGTLLLDEIGELPPSLQAKLLRALESREVYPVGSTQPVRFRARILAATNGDLEGLMGRGGFRPDLYFRLNIVRIRLPALRDRPEDIPVTAETLLERLRRRMNRDPVTLEACAVEALQRYPWPGNVRELANVLERSLLLCAGPSLRASDLPDDLHRSPPQDADNLTRAREQFEQRHIDRVLARFGGDKVRAAEALGIDLSTLYRKRRHPD